MKTIRIIIPVLLAGLAALGFFFFKKPMYKSGTVIILNGPSTAGKSSIQKEFQNLMIPNLWIKLGIDNLFDKPMPDITPDNMNIWLTENPIRWVEIIRDDQNKPIVTLFMGNQGEAVAYGMNSAIAAYAKAGCNVIVDYIAYKKEWADDLHAKLRGITSYWVKVSAPLSVLEAREIARKTSPPGHARSHYHVVDWDISYDLEVDSSKSNAQTIAKNLKKTFISQ